MTGYVHLDRGVGNQHADSDGTQTYILQVRCGVMAGRSALQRMLRGCNPVDWWRDSTLPSQLSHHCKVH